MKYFLALLLFLSTNNASALTRKNDYAGSASCANNATTAGDCETLGYSTDNEANCEHYLYCPFNPSYKRCASKTADVPETNCTTGALNPVCETGFSPYKIGETSDLKMCLECQPATCTAYNANYKTASEYMSSSTFPLFIVKTASLVTSPTEKQPQACYTSCNSGITLKKVSSSNCSIGDVVVMFNGITDGDDIYCTSSTAAPSSSCAYYTRLGVVGYKSGSNIWAVKTTSKGSLNSTNTWPKGKNCHTLYDNAKKATDYSYNAQVLTGNTSSEFGKAGCSLYGAIAGQFGYSSAYITFYYGFPNQTMLSNIAKNVSTINTALKQMGWTEIPVGNDCSGTNKIWYDNGFTINYNGTSSSSDLAYGYTGAISSTSFTPCGTPVSLNSSNYGVQVLDISKL